MRRIAPLALGLMIAVAPVQPVLAAEDKAAAQAQTIALEAVALPVIVNGQLLNYVFCSVRLDLAPNADGAKVRAKEQYFRDDLVRTGHRTPFTRADDYSRVDEAKVRAEVLRSRLNHRGARRGAVGGHHQAEPRRRCHPAACAADGFARNRPLTRPSAR